MTRAYAIAIPNALTVSRLLAGPAFLIWASLPARGLVLIGLFAAVATDLADGRIARALEATSSIGGGLDTVADKIFALCLVLRLTEASVVPAWTFATLLAQYVLLASIGSFYMYRFHNIPAPEKWAHISALFAIAAIIVGVITLNRSWTLALATLLVGANFAHIAVAWRRATGVEELSGARCDGLGA